MVQIARAPSQDLFNDHISDAPGFCKRLSLLTPSLPYNAGKMWLRGVMSAQGCTTVYIKHGEDLRRLPCGDLGHLFLIHAAPREAVRLIVFPYHCRSAMWMFAIFGLRSAVLGRKIQPQYNTAAQTVFIDVFLAFVDVTHHLQLLGDSQRIDGEKDYLSVLGT
jgi:hypothetical protein